MFNNHKYNLILLESLLVGNRSLKLPSVNAMTNQEETYFIIKDCLRVQEYFVCDRENLVDYSQDGCFSKLLRGSSGNCTFKEILQPTEIKQIADNYLVLKQVFTETMKTTCGIKNRTLTGSFLVEYHNCTVEINNTKFSNEEILRRESFDLISLDGLNIQTHSVEPVADFKWLSLKNRHHLDTFTKMHNLTSYTSISLSSFSMLIGVGIIIFLVQKQIFKLRQPAPNKNRDDSFPKEDLVKDPSSTLEQTLNRIGQQQQQLGDALDKIKQQQQQ